VKLFVAHANQLFRGGYRGWITVVHGYGSTGVGGTIKARLREFLVRHADTYEYLFNDGFNPGCTDVRILRELPAFGRRGTPLEDRLESFCESPKEESKIAAKFHRCKLAELRRLLARLHAEGRLAKVRTNGRTAWQAIDSSGEPA